MIDSASTSNAALVSVALCTYNGERFIAEQLRSILAQDERIAEIVIADDGSTDATLEIVRQVAADAQRAGSTIDIRILDGAGGNGVTKNFERAVTACRHDLIALSDQDDVWRTGRLALQLTEFGSRPDLSLLFGDARLVDEAGASLGSTLFATLELDRATRLALRTDGAFSALLRRNVVTGATVLFRRSLLVEALPFPAEWIHDEWLAIIAAATGRIDLIEEVLTDYRQHGSNEIGVSAPTFRNKVKRVFQQRADRNRDLALRSQILLGRIVALGLDESRLLPARKKAEFEQFRADLAPARIRRVVPVLRRAATGDYERYASQGRTDVVRDLLQPA